MGRRHRLLTCCETFENVRALKQGCRTLGALCQRLYEKASQRGSSDTPVMEGRLDLLVREAFEHHVRHAQRAVVALFTHASEI